MNTYTTVQGDMWDAIAHRELGSAMHMGKLLAVNPDYVQVYIFPAGVVLELPVITSDTADSLPPWKQVLG